MPKTQIKKQNPEPKLEKLQKKNQPKPVVYKQIVIDADKKTLGRISSEIATVLRGKNTVNFCYNQVLPIKVVVINAQNIEVTGNKLTQKLYYRHSGYIGSLKSVQLKEKLAKNPEEVLRLAVKGMLPKNKLQDKWLNNLKIFRGAQGVTDGK